MAIRIRRDELKARLRAAAPAVLPSILASDFAHLQREVKAVEAAGVTALHLDVMDGHFVPNISFGIPVVQAVRLFETRDQTLTVDDLMTLGPQEILASRVLAKTPEQSA